MMESFILYLHSFAFDTIRGFNKRSFYPCFQGVRIYGVQVNETAKSTEFFKTMTEATEGQHLKLSQFGTLCDVIMAICYREKGAEFLHVSVKRTALPYIGPAV